MVFLEQKWLWAKLPIKLPLRVPHRSSGLNHTMQVIAQHSALESMPLPGWSCGVPTSDCCNGYSLSPRGWRYCSHLHRPDPVLSHELLAFAVFLYWHFPLAVWAKHNICHQLFVIQLILPFPYGTGVCPHFISTCPIHRFISPASPAWTAMVSGQCLLSQAREVVLNTAPARCAAHAGGLATKKGERGLFLEAWFCICGWFS